MRDSVPSASYSSVCNVLRQWNIPLIPTYRVYRLYDSHDFMSCAEMTSKVGVAHKISSALTRAVYLAPPTVNPGSAPAMK